MNSITEQDRLPVHNPHRVIQQAAAEIFLRRQGGQFVVNCRHCRCVTIPTHFFQAAYWCRYNRIRRVLELLSLVGCSRADQKAIAARCARLLGSWRAAARSAIREAKEGRA
ncbi:hypothetical protein [Halomonas lysinitropha]|uniref:Uncharacterized protein n=1 Tax=Halomonas lysinitropha TaxID=2607506 RepID=A0A5K1I6A3_9GAMM|nr:hypothetical protein [Halomonas lysinitropha]VVZ94642.1 hypothetical protein HALO32_00697 [Halomonas lysinitropha]